MKLADLTMGVTTDDADWEAMLNHIYELFATQYEEALTFCSVKQVVAFSVGAGSYSTERLMFVKLHLNNDTVDVYFDDALITTIQRPETKVKNHWLDKKRGA